MNVLVLAAAPTDKRTDRSIGLSAVFSSREDSAGATDGAARRASNGMTFMHKWSSQNDLLSSRASASRTRDVWADCQRASRGSAYGQYDPR